MSSLCFFVVIPEEVSHEKSFPLAAFQFELSAQDTIVCYFQLGKEMLFGSCVD
jgi:hypothetical protein